MKVMEERRNREEHPGLEERLQAVMTAQKTFFDSGATRDVSSRRALLKRLRTAILQKEPEICEALRSDLGKGAAESYMTEIGTALSGIRYLLSHLSGLTRRRRVRGTLSSFPSSQSILPEPYGRVLVMAPWNYPFLLCIDPLTAAVAAGNCVVLKPSELAPATSRVVNRLLSDVFPPEWVAVQEGGQDVGEALLRQRFDYIFYTGSKRVGRAVMRAAAAHLTPLTLELGGKSPCIVDETADLRQSMRRVIFGKTLNSGQTCVAPDYLIVHRSHREQLKPVFELCVEQAWGKDPISAPDYPSVVNLRHFERLESCLDQCRILSGGRSDQQSLKMAPQLVEAENMDAPVMQEELFGPILPVVWYDRIEEVIDFVSSREKPLALYVFSRNRRTVQRILRTLSFGGGCVNDTILHLTNPELPFGGVGESGMGAYHGKAGFDTFTHYKSVLSRPFGWDNGLRYPPFTKWKRRLVRLFLK